MPLRDKLRCLRELGKVTGGRVAAQMDRGRVLGFVTERGEFRVARGRPGADDGDTGGGGCGGGIVDAVAPGDTVVADGESGMGLVNPDPGELRGWEERKRGWDDRRKRLGSLVTLPVVTNPSEDEQFEAYRRVAQAFSGRTVIIRTLDVGGDKPIPWLGRLDEANPFLGLRRIRLCVEREEVFLTQLRALLRGRVYGDVTSEGALVWSK